MKRILARFASGPGSLLGRRGIRVTPGGISGGLGRIRVMVGLGRGGPVWATPCRRNVDCRMKRMVNNFGHISWNYHRDMRERGVCQCGR